VDSEQSADDRAAERVVRGESAHRRAQQAGSRAAELRDQLDAALHGDPAHGSSVEDVTRSRQHAEEADARLELAFERGAQAHDRAADLHERQAGPDPELSGDRVADPQSTEPAGGHAQHAQHAQQHRDAAEADRELARKVRERRQPPAG
jgi:hypothetical protein